MPEPSTLVVSVLMALFGSIVGAWIWVILRLCFGLSVLPPNTPRFVPWGAGSVLVVMLSWIALNSLVLIVYYQGIRARPAGGGAEVRPSLVPGEILALLCIQNSASLVLVPLILAATSGARARDFGVVGSGLGKQVARGVVAYCLLVPVVLLVSGLSMRIWGRTPHPVEEAIAQNKSPGLVALAVLGAFILAPAAEELIFRGVLLGWLTRVVLGQDKPASAASMIGGIGEIFPDSLVQPLPETMEIDSLGTAALIKPAETAELAIDNPYAPPVSAITTTIEADSLDPKTRALPLFAANVAVSLIFASLHSAVWPTPVPLFFLSLGLGFLYQRTGSLVASTALHMTFNGVSTLLMFVWLGGAPAPKIADPIPGPAQAVTMTVGEFFSFDPAR